MNELKNEGEELNPEAEEIAEEEVEANESETEVETESDENIDFESELKKVEQRLGGKIDKERAKKNELKKNMLTREEVEKITEDKIAQVEKRIFRSRAELLAERLAKSSAEKDLILFHYDNSIISTGNIEEDIDNAFVLANKKKIQGQISELKKAAMSKKNINSGGSEGGASIKNEKQQKYSQDIIDGAKFAGKTPEEFAKSLEKSLEK